MDQRLEGLIEVAAAAVVRLRHLSSELPYVRDQQTAWAIAELLDAAMVAASGEPVLDRE